MYNSRISNQIGAPEYPATAAGRRGRAVRRAPPVNGVFFAVHRCEARRGRANSRRPGRPRRTTTTTRTETAARTAATTAHRRTQPHRGSRVTRHRPAPHPPPTKESENRRRTAPHQPPVAKNHLSARSGAQKRRSETRPRATEDETANSCIFPDMFTPRHDRTRSMEPIDRAVVACFFATDLTSVTQVLWPWELEQSSGWAQMPPTQPKVFQVL